MYVSCGMLSERHRLPRGVTAIGKSYRGRQAGLIAAEVSDIHSPAKAPQDTSPLHRFIEATIGRR